MSAKRESVSDFAQVYGDIAAFILKDQAALRMPWFWDWPREHDRSIKHGGILSSNPIGFLPKPMLCFK